MPAPLLLISGVCLIMLLLVLSCPQSFSIRVYGDRKCLVRHGIFINLVIWEGLSFRRYRADMSVSVMWVTVLKGSEGNTGEAGR